MKNYTSADITANGLYGFSCSGTNDYIKTKLYVASCTTPILTATIYAVVNGCFKISETNSTLDGYQQGQCNATAAVVSIYGSAFPTCDVFTGFAFLSQQTLISTTCSYYSTSTYTVYAKLMDCVYDGYSNFPASMNNSNKYTGMTPYKGITLHVEASAESETFPDPMVCGLDWYTFFEAYFNKSAVSVTTTCNSYEGMAYPSIAVDTDVTVYQADLFQSCSTIIANLQMAFSNYTNVVLTTTCAEYEIETTTTTTTSTATPTIATTDDSFGKMVTINYLIVFAISCVAMTMYI